MFFRKLYGTVVIGHHSAINCGYCKFKNVYRMDWLKILELLRSIVSDPFYRSYIRHDQDESQTALRESPLVSEDIQKALKIISSTRYERVSPTFKLVFLTIFFLTVVCGLRATTIAFLAADPLTTNQQTIFESLNTSWKLGIAAIVGLIGGKAT